MVLITGKLGMLEVEPTFSEDKVIFHPLPKVLQIKYRDGDDVEGKFGVERPTGKFDKRGVQIFVSYFIPDREKR